jgi:hypothetical protein
MPGDRLGEAARRRRGERPALDLGLRHRRLGGGDLAALVGFDAGEDVAHRVTPRSRPG